MGFAAVFPVTGQTYPRKMDSRVLGVLSGIAQSAHKFSNDLRLLQHLKEIEEPFGKDQIGSFGDGLQAQPDAQRAPASLARHVIRQQPQPGDHGRRPVV